MSAHKPSYRPMDYRTRKIWSVGCSCGWRCAAPIRGERARERATESWREHRAEVETHALGRQMRAIPRGQGERP